MVARRLTLTAAALVLAGCGAPPYSERAAVRAAGGHAHTVIPYFGPSFATWAAVTELDLDPAPPFVVYESDRLAVLRFADAHDAQAFLRSGQIRELDAQVIGASADALVLRRRNIVLVGARAAVQAALRRLG
jgi:hypothetical protein